MANQPAPGARDLFPHVSVINSPGNPLHGEVVMSPRVMGLLIAPSVEEFTAFWDENAERVKDAMKAGRNEFPKHWQRWARRRSNELQARYGSTSFVDILRGLQRDYGVLPTGGEL
ncbi:hypothetical protein SAMN05443665_104574 [Actinomadura meyerae]|uniref:Uncharacterized protein n=1 Tax=Actinomadura meyerae TaxID=240840 RepID=A0A239NP58_9ACTN|nr:hypothetical protein [Actinomadura meyerae]SNT56701.1 hypothetical protein SAMN05443665_104574 [Actinomadura meyerae]